MTTMTMSSTQHAAVEILGPWLPNKGDAMMLHAVAERLGGRYVLGVSSTLGMKELPDHPVLHRVTWKPSLREVREAARTKSVGAACGLLRRRAGLALRPRSVLRAAGKVDARDLVALLDCSGFAYGDQWSPHRIEQRVKYYDRLRQRDGVKLVMLPQALGPFRTPQVREHARALFERFDLIFAREAASREHVLSTGVDAARVGQAPDVTHLLRGAPPSDADGWRSRVCIVPNSRMVDRTAPDVGRRYVDFMTTVIRTVRHAGLEPTVVVHETNDAELVRQILSQVDFTVRVFDDDALVTKGYLGCCYANIGSRYHSLVSSLSQATPSIGTSWAHKYDELFDEYGCRDLLISPDRDVAEVEQLVQAFLTPHRRAELHASLTAAATRQRAKVESMWTSVEQLLDRAAATVAPARE